jgi:hypothetical protein
MLDVNDDEKMNLTIHDEEHKGFVTKSDKLSQIPHVTIVLQLVMDPVQKKY